MILRNDASVRQLEGLETEGPRVVRSLPDTDLNHALIKVDSPHAPTFLEADLLEGQKTGLFLDQAANIQLAAEVLRGLTPKLRVLDLCCYVGQ